MVNLTARSLVKFVSISPSMDYGMALHLTKGVKLKVWKNKSLVMFHAKLLGHILALKYFLLCFDIL